jgi:hypothetical protein
MGRVLGRGVWERDAGEGTRSTNCIASSKQEHYSMGRGARCYLDEALKDDDYYDMIC